MTNHIILTAFGTTTRAQETYRQFEKQIAACFPHCQIHWAFSSPTVRKISAQLDIAPASVGEIVSSLQDPGEIVIQSLHVLPGYEFHRIAAECLTLPVAAAVGRPLLDGPEDFIGTAGALKVLIESSGLGATLVLGHGTNHPSRYLFLQLQRELHNQVGPQVFFTTIEKPLEPVELVIEKISRAGHKKLFCVPFLMVAGMHFFRDIIGDHQDSWKNRFQQHHIDLHVHDQGIALLEGIGNIVCNHIQAAFDSLHQ